MLQSLLCLLPHHGVTGKVLWHKTRNRGRSSRWLEMRCPRWQRLRDGHAVGVRSGLTGVYQTPPTATRKAAGEPPDQLLSAAADALRT
jgi:hypothetical protein